MQNTKLRSICSLTFAPALRWLLVLNNVDEPQILQDYWPSTGRGFILLTSRVSTPLPFLMLSRSFVRVSEFSTEEGAQCLINLIGQRAPTSDEDYDAARTLTNMLGGHALAISQMAALIWSRGLSIKEGATQYQAQQRNVYGPDGRNNDLAALWTWQFGNLSPDERQLLGIIMFLSADAIPENLLNPDENEEDPDSDESEISVKPLK